MSALAGRRIALDLDEPAPYETDERSYKGAGWVLFAAIMLVMGATLSIVWAVAAYQLWSLALVAIDVLVIYGLAAYGGKPYLTR